MSQDIRNLPWLAVGWALTWFQFLLWTGLLGVVLGGCANPLGHDTRQQDRQLAEYRKAAGK